MGMMFKSVCTHFADVNPGPIEYPPLRPFPSDVIQLEGVERLFEDDPGFKGPESFAFSEDGSLYTGLADGRIVRVLNLDATPTYTTIARTGEDVEGCGTLDMEEVCGRPLGLRWDPTHPGHLLVADAYKGLLRVDVTAKEAVVAVLVSSATKGLTLVNDLDVTADGRFVFFTNTGRFPRNQIHKNLAEARPTGQVWVYETATQTARVLVDALVMPNGITLTHDNSALLVCTAFVGLHRVDVPAGGLDSLSSEQPPRLLEAVMVNNDIQGSVDNIRRFMPPDASIGRGGGTYLVGLGSKRSSPFFLPQMLAPFPTLRRLVSFIGLETITSLIPRACLLLEVDSHGKELRTFMDQTTTCYWASEAELGNSDWLYIGSWRTPFLARAKFSGM